MVTNSPSPSYETSRHALLSEEWLRHWDFSNTPTNLLRGHGLDDIPGGITPALANKLIVSLTKKGDLVLDLAARNGSTLLEAMHLGRRSVGLVPCPVATNQARLKCLRLGKEDLLQLERLVTEFFTVLNQHLDAKSSNKKRQGVLLDTLMTKCKGNSSAFVMRVFNKMAQNVFGGDCDRVKYSHPDLITSCENKMRQILYILHENNEISYKTFEPLVILADGRVRQDLTFLYAPESRSGLVDLVLTAPALTTSADLEEIDRRVFDTAPSLQHPWQVLSGQIAALENRGANAATLHHLANRTGSFYRGLQQYVENAAFYLRPNGLAAWVLAEHTVSQVEFPVLKALTELSEAVGMKHFYTFEGINLISGGKIIYPLKKQYVMLFRKI